MYRNTMDDNNQKNNNLVDFGVNVNVPTYVFVALALSIAMPLFMAIIIKYMIKA